MVEVVVVIEVVIVVVAVVVVKAEVVVVVWCSCSWLGARRRPRHETVFLLVHCTGATARAHFFLFFLCFASVKPLFLSFFVVFFLAWCWLGGWGAGGWGGVITFFGLEHIWDGTS